IESATTLFRGMASAGGNAASSLTKAMTGLGGAIAGLGITAAILAFKELNAEAANFEQRLQGVNLAQAAKAARDVYKQSLYDQTGRGDDFAYTKEYWQTRLSMGWQNMMTGADPAQREQAMRAAERAAALASERVEIQRELDKYVRQEAVLQSQINELRNTAGDRSKTEEERSKAKTQAENTINVLYNTRIGLQQRLADNLRETNGLVSSTDDEMRAQYAAEAAVYSLEGARQSQLRGFIRIGNQLESSSKAQASSAKETQQATELTLAAATELVEKERALKAIQDQNNAMKAAARFRMEGALPGMETPGNLQASANTLTVPALIKPVVDTEAAQKAVVELSSVIEQGVVGMSEALGDLIGNLINGENAWQGFAQAGIGVVADMLSTVGKAFVTEGVGVIAAQMALKTGNGPAAIAAGAAMIALAATMKTAMSNAAANWSGGSGAAVASSSYSSGTSAPSTYGREMVVRVTGTLTGEGSKLKAVINNDDRRNNVTT
ncbi:MAG: hypothetical protein II518_00925, partial [Candidatus Methanomethylophilus sp.]|nr:hypothetical protein [Methanomethylophilus sp.]